MDAPVLMRGLAVSAAVALVATAAVAQFAAAAPATDARRSPVAASPIVVGVELRSDVPLDRPEAIWRLVEIERGEPLSEQRVERTLRNLAAAGRVADAHIYARPAPGGVTAVLAMWARPRVAEVQLLGEIGLRRSDLQQVLVVHRDEPLIESRIVRSALALHDRLVSRGYLDARVTYRVAEGTAPKEVVVAFQIDAGQPARISSFQFSGDHAPIAASELSGFLGFGPNDSYRPEMGRLGADRLERRLIERGYGTARVEFAGIEREEVGRGVILIWNLQIGPRLELRVRGVERRTLERRDLIPFMGSDGYDEALLWLAEDRIREHYQRQGHWEVEVELEERREAGVVHIDLTVEPGPIFTLETVSFEGNETFSDDRLRELILVSPPRLTARGSGRLVGAILADDLSNLRGFYALEGFHQARVGPERVLTEGESLDLTIPIVEGPRQRVASIELAGVESLDPEALLRALPLAESAGYHPQHLDDCLATIRSLYEDSGYLWIQVSHEIEWNRDGTLAAITLNVLEGPQAQIDRVIIRGLHRTDEEVVRRSLQLRPPEPYSIRRRLEMQRRLYDLGVFSQVEVSLAPGTPYETRRNLLVRVREGENRRVSYGLGYESEQGARGHLGVGHSNLLGRAVRAQADAQVAQEEYQLRLLARQPLLRHWRLPVTYSLFRLEERRQDFLSRRRGAQVQIERTGEHWRATLLYNYRIVELVPDADLDPLTIERQFRSVDVASLTPGLLIDFRDDPIDPRRGWSTNVQLEYAFPLIQAEAEFFKLFLHGTRFLDLGRTGVLAASLRLGAIEPVGSIDPEPNDLPDPFPTTGVPISERYFAGGRASHRAYRRDSLGVIGQTLIPVTVGDERELLAIGGNALAMFNLDYRFPIIGALEGTLFADYGNVWADWSSFDGSAAKPGTGVGVRYRSPIGPIRLEIGWKLDRRSAGDEFPERPYEILFSFGNPF